MEAVMAQETKKNKGTCPTCMGKTVIEARCETSGEWEGVATEDGQICTPTNICPTCNGKGYVED
jgi:hypothetical protein